jgi:mono/diheme cytochrome c family protein
MRRSLLALAVVLAAIGLFTAGLAWLLDTPGPPAGASTGERLYRALCSDCHGVDGRGSWRAALFLINPGDLTDRRRMSGYPDQYLFDIIKHGGAPIGRPGMPGFGSRLDDAAVRALVEYVRALGAEPSGAHPSGQLRDADQHDLVTSPPHGQAHPVSGADARGVEPGGLRQHRHRLHRFHAQRGHGGVPDKDHVRSRPRDDFAPDLPGGRADDGAPDPRAEGSEQDREEGAEQPAGPARGAGAQAGGRRDPSGNVTASPPPAPHREATRA